MVFYLKFHIGTICPAKAMVFEKKKDIRQSLVRLHELKLSYSCIPCSYKSILDKVEVTKLSSHT